MLTKLIPLGLVVLAAVCILPCSLLTTNGKPSKMRAQIPTYVERGFKAFYEKANGNQVQNQLGEVPTAIIGPSLPEEIYILYPNDIPSSQSLQVNADNEIGAFSEDVSKNPYEHNQLLLNNGIVDYIFLLVPNTYDYDNIYQDQNLNRRPIAPNDFLDSPMPSFTVTPQDYPIYHQNIPPQYIEHETGVSFQSQSVGYGRPKPHVPLSVDDMKTPQQDIKHESPDVEIIKAVGYELPNQTPTYQPVPITRSYYFEDTYESESDKQEPEDEETVEREENNSRMNWDRDAGVKNETEDAQNYLDDPIVVEDEEDVESSSQYYQSNRKPITFESVQDGNQQNVIEMVYKTPNENLANSDLQNSTEIISPEYNSSKIASTTR